MYLADYLKILDSERLFKMENFTYARFEVLVNKVWRRFVFPVFVVLIPSGIITAILVVLKVMLSK